MSDEVITTVPTNAQEADEDKEVQINVLVRLAINLRLRGNRIVGMEMDAIADEDTNADDK